MGRPRPRPRRCRRLDPRVCCVQLVTAAARAWALRRGGGRVAQAALLHGAWRWEPSRALRYRLLLRLALAPGGDPDSDSAFTYVGASLMRQRIPFPFAFYQLFHDVVYSK